MHIPTTIAISVIICLLSGHIERMNRIELTPDFERQADLGWAINDPDTPA